MVTGSAGPVGRRTVLLSVLGLGFTGLPAASAQAATARAAYPGQRQDGVPRVSYDRTVLDDRPAAYWTLGSPHRRTEKDATGSGHTGTYFGRAAAAALPNGDTAADFDGNTGYLQVRDASALSPATRGVLTVEAWLRPDTLSFPEKEGNKGYLHWMGKGGPGSHEYAARMYSSTDPERPNRISGYLFNASGGKGAGSYFQDRLHAGSWIHYVLVINANAKSDGYPNGYTRIYRDGVRRQTRNLDYDGTVIVPARGSAPFRIGTRDLGSFFEGAIGKVAVYPRELPAARILAHYNAMMRK